MKQDDKINFEELQYVVDEPVPGKELAWQLTPIEYQSSQAIIRSGMPYPLEEKDKDLHKQLVAWAVQQGKDVPEEILEFYPELNFDSTQNLSGIEQEYKEAIDKKDFLEAARVLYKLFENVIKGEYIELVPFFIREGNNPLIKKELKLIGLGNLTIELLDNEEFKAQLQTNIWNLIPEEYKKPAPTIKAIEWEADPQNKALAGLVKEFLGTDEFRLSTLGVDFEKEGTVATDAQKLIFLNKAFEGKKGIYCMSKKCNDTFPENNHLPIDVKFPDYISILPNEFSVVLTVQLEVLRNYCKSLIKTFLTRKTLSLKFQYNPDGLIGFNASYLLDCIEAFMKLGFKEADFGFIAPDKLILITPVGKNSEAIQQTVPFIVLMPVMLQVKKVSEMEKGILYFDLMDQSIKTSGINDPVKTSISNKELGTSTIELRTKNFELRTPNHELLKGDEWFKQHPGKVLGEPYETTNRFNKKVIKIRGDMDNVVQGIDVPAVHIADENTEALETIIKEPLDDLLNDESKKANIEKVIAETKIARTEKQLKQLKGEKDKYEEGCPEEYYCFEEIMQQYNKGIADDEIKAWIWYKRKSGGFNDEKVILNTKNGWSKYVVPLAEVSRYLEGWLKQGILCFYQADYIPAVLYYAENIYQRLEVLQKEKAQLIEKFGEDQYERQFKGLQNILPARLSLTNPVADDRLFIKPDAAFLKDFSIQQLADGTKLNQEDENSSGGIGLVIAFKKWLKEIPKEEFKKSTDFNIIQYYLDKKNLPRYIDEEQKQRTKQYARQEGDQFFVRFLAEALTAEDQLRLEESWNARYNAYIDINYFKVPVAFTCSSTFKNKPLFIRAAQREGIGFMSVHGSGCVAYDVGVGKTMTAILSLAQALETGQCKRPFVVVPNQTYSNWLNELRGFVEDGKIVLSGILPQYPVNDLYNLSEEYIEKLKDKNGAVQLLPENSITVLTYEGFNRLCFSEPTWETIGEQLFEMLNQGMEKQDKKSKREREQLYENIEEMMGKGIRGGLVNIEDLGLDYIVVDEAHAMKKSFTHVRGEIKGNEREKSNYDISSGEASMIALRGFMIAQYILHNNNMRNVQLLTATPFTNSPLEIYSILALIGFQQLEQWGIKNIKDFFDTFIKTSIELVINARLQPERKEVVLGFHNLIALQQLIFKFIIYKSGEEANIQRPNKIVLPLLNKMVNGQLIPLSADEQVSTNLPMSALQKMYMQDIEAYITGKGDPDNFCVNSKGQTEDETEKGSTTGKAIPVDENKLSKEEKEGARVLRGLSFARQLALSPFLYACNPNHNPSFTEYVETSPKLFYIMQCIQSVKHYHESKGEEVSGQVIYMNAGVHFFPLLKEYLIKKIGFKENEVGIISSGISRSKKEGIKERFQAGAVKIIIGSATIKEGINLQNRTTVLYNCWLDWNPTDVKQLEGRVWRFGNIFANVRIVNPLMEDSVDMFIFQKLEEKTSRINEIWQRAGKSNSLKLEEFNPAELKMGLVTNPRMLAELMLMEEKEKLNDEITDLFNKRTIIEQVNAHRKLFNENIPHIKKTADKYRPQKEGSKGRNTDTYLSIFRDYLDDENANHNYKDEGIFQQVRSANTALNRALKEVLQPRGLVMDFDEKTVLLRIDKEIKKLQRTLDDTTGAVAIETKMEDIEKERIKKGFKRKTVKERVEEFARLNPHLLSELMVYAQGEEAEFKRKKQVTKGEELEGSADAVEELESLIKDMEEMEQLLAELDRLNAA